MIYQYPAQRQARTEKLHHKGQIKLDHILNQTEDPQLKQLPVSASDVTAPDWKVHIVHFSHIRNPTLTKIATEHVATEREVRKLSLRPPTSAFRFKNNRERFDCKRIAQMLKIKYAKQVCDIIAREVYHGLIALHYTTAPKREYDMAPRRFRPGLRRIPCLCEEVGTT